MLSNSLKQLTNYRVLLFKLLGTRQGMRQEFGSAIISQRGRFLYERFLYSGTAENNKHIRYCNIPYEHHVDSTADEVIWCSSEKWTIFCLAKKRRQVFWRECGGGGAWRGNCWLPNNASHVSKKASAFYGATVEATEKKN